MDGRLSSKHQTCYQLHIVANSTIHFSNDKYMEEKKVFWMPMLIHTLRTHLYSCIQGEQ